MDCFYAAVEMRDNPKLRNIPIAIGGPSKTKGVLCTSNYLAREFGVRAAMPTFKAFELCPHLTLVPPNFEKYEIVSNQIKKIFFDYSDKVQMLSLDEAFIDVTDSDHHAGSATLIAKEIKDRIFTETKLTASAGVACNKMLAKIASDWKKPNGLFCIPPEQVNFFIKDLPLRKIPGIGKVSALHLEKFGFKKCEDISKTNIFELIRKLGKRSALDLYEASIGVDNTLVTPRTQRKSLGIERTYFEDISISELLDFNFQEIITMFDERIENVSEYHLNDRSISHLFIKIRFEDFETHTRDLMISPELAYRLLETRRLNEEAINILKKATKDFLSVNTHRNIRLYGIGLRFKDSCAYQMPLPLGGIL